MDASLSATLHAHALLSSWLPRTLLSLPWYRGHIDGAQEVMIGYSDSAKDAGRMAAAWAQYNAQVLKTSRYF